MGSMTTATEPVRSIDPRTGEVVETVAEQTDAETVARLCAAAVEATARLAAMSFADRAEMLEAMAAALEGDRERLVDIADRESALGRPRLDGEVTRTATQLRLFAAVLRDGAFAEATIDHATDASPDLRRMLIGLGPVSVFGASNFPFAFSAAGGDTASALAAGCAVIVKAHGAHPALDAAVVALLRDAAGRTAAGEDAVSVVYGREAGTAVVADARIRAVGFTGSERAGRMLMDLAAARPEPIPVYAEMGSLNPLVVTPGSAERGAEIAATIADSVLLGGGQFCTKPGLVFLPEGAAGDAVVSALVERIGASDAIHLLSIDIRDTFMKGAAAVAASADAAALVTPSAGTGSAATPALNEVAVASLFGADELIAECFGPAALVVRYGTIAQVVDVIDRLPASLTLSVFAEDAESDAVAAIAAAATERVGRIILNGVSTGVAVNWAQQHGGPYPAASSAMHTSVGATAIRRFLRPVAYQSFTDALLPPALQESNPLGIPRRVDGRLEVNG
ncbi:aldehyde dehydrogenase family protein [Microbacterium sp. Mu-80]|uniref:Aldehyde dehydrogenase family protein n=1 Tax=Microbacterium bandirmense TaxID=3122050 RepID=A0ABU8LET1_9MICO